MPDDEWGAFKEAKGCCPVGTGVPLDYTLRHVFGSRKRGGFFIESGANDGQTQSNTYLFWKHRGWGGLLVEPFPSTFSRLSSERCLEGAPDHDRNVCVRRALIDDAKATPALRLSDNNLMAKQVGSGGVEVPTARMGDLLDEHFRQPDGTVPIDLWSLDIEGAELPALKGVDWNRQRPAFVLVETPVFDQINAFLTSVGYELVTGAVVHGNANSVSGWTHVAQHDHLWRDRFAGADVPKGPPSPLSWPPPS